MVFVVFLLKGMVGGSYRLIVYHSENYAHACDCKLDLTYNPRLFVEHVSCRLPHKHAIQIVINPQALWNIKIILDSYSVKNLLIFIFYVLKNDHQSNHSKFKFYFKVNQFH